MAKKIYYEMAAKELPKVLPTIRVAPEWYKKAKKFGGSKPRFQPDLNTTVKECMPFLDALSAGYVIVLTHDVIVNLNNRGLPEFSWQMSNIPLVDVRSPMASGHMPIPQGFCEMYTAWRTFASIKIPDGYSALITHPLNRNDLPFQTASGIVDGYDMAGGSLPFFLKQGFEGLIPQGTPLAQIIPFKRESWVLEEQKGLHERAALNAVSSRLVFTGWYKKNIWKKKSYE